MSYRRRYTNDREFKAQGWGLLFFGAFCLWFAGWMIFSFGRRFFGD